MNVKCNEKNTNIVLAVIWLSDNPLMDHRDLNSINGKHPLFMKTVDEQRRTEKENPL